MELTNQIEHDGSRWFLALPESVSWYKLRDHLACLAGAEVTAFLTDHVTEAWIDFQYRGYDLTINNQFGEFGSRATLGRHPAEMKGLATRGCTRSPASYCGVLVRSTQWLGSDYNKYAA